LANDLLTFFASRRETPAIAHIAANGGLAGTFKVFLQFRFPSVGTHSQDLAGRGGAGLSAAVRCFPTIRRWNAALKPSRIDGVPPNNKILVAMEILPAVGDGQAPQDEKEEGEGATDDDDRPLSDSLIRDLTAHRTLGLRLNLSEQPEVALVAATHALAAQIFHLGADTHVVGIRPIKTDLAVHADGIEDTAAGKAWADRHADWARQMPRDVTALWTFVTELDHDSRMALFAHCVALTVNAVKLPWERKSRTQATADKLAEAVSLDMTGYWRPTARTYLGRITKVRILEAVREGVSIDAADRMANMKKQDMAEAAEKVLAGTGWLPALLRTARAAQGPAESPQDAATEPKNTEAYAVAAE
jgi:ParB family chromosome partitioning protein